MPCGSRPANLVVMDDNTMTRNDSPIRTFRRSRNDRMIAGVCGGAAQLLGIDTAILRVILVAATLFGFGAGAVFYLICWMVVPED